MLNELKFCMGAVAKRELAPAMTHFKIENGRVSSFNGQMALSSPIACDLNCIPKADALVKAIALCDETILLALTDTKKLRVQSGSFKAFIETVDVEPPHVEPSGTIVQIDGKVILDAFKKLNAFVGDDASRPWTNGILLRNQSAFATNNVVLVEYWLGVDMPFVVNIPKPAIIEMIRLDEPPTHCQIEETSITFHYSDGRWLRTQLYETKWPDLSRILDVAHSASPVDERLFGALDYLKPFADSLGRVYINEGIISTHQDLDMGASFEISGLPMRGIYRIEMLELLHGVATKADFTRYPDPTIFYGDRLRGAIVGMQM